MNKGNVLDLANLANAAMTVPTLIAYRSRSNRVWIFSTIAFYVIFAITFFGLYSTPGSHEGFLLSR